LVDETISAMRKFQQKAKHKNDESKTAVGVFAVRLRFWVADLEMMSSPSHRDTKTWLGNGVAALRLAALSP
jgi:hypothetical protein